ncbi:N-acetyltransferase [uncultured Porphyromonas sp.]|jgi:hypothetical protein|uniref:N-acetyltransferase n=1 Tax=uncultured Porphyromonas sp. TaxID=159274 RepID=UPI0025DAEEC8|nr:N-acetyltransferase [uncultured Porphyromonas sp.]
MVIRQSTPEDLLEILRLIAVARAFMTEHGNPSQWPEGYPSAEQLSSDIAHGHSYVCVAPEYAGLVGTFYFAVEEEPTYRHIEGRWPNDKPYGVIHRLASDGRVRGLFRECLAFASKYCSEIRVDTHEDNTPMRQLLVAEGFIPCGTVYIADGSPRIAYQKSLEG